MQQSLPCLSLAVLASLASAQDDSQALVRFEPAFPAQDKFDKPLFLAHHPSDPSSYYVVTQPGFVFRIPRDGSSTDREVFLDLSKRVLTDNWEEGLLGFAFDPAYPEKRVVYVYYSEKTGQREVQRRGRTRTEIARQSVVSRLDVVDGEKGPVAVPDEELRILEIEQPYGNHNGGTIVFGPDRMLYIALGDGGAANDPHGNGQDKGTLLASVLRIDVSASRPEEPYRIPADNPFVGEEGARGEIWAYGLRNPWRITFDRATGDLWCGDVGQNSFEEVDRIVKGGNYGWNFMEGTHEFDARRAGGEIPDDLIPPVAEYGRREGQSVTGGYVYRGKRLPDLVGEFVYGDFHTFRVWSVREDRDAGEHRVTYLGRAPNLLASFAEDPEGELMVMCYDGVIYRMLPASQGQ